MVVLVLFCLLFSFDLGELAMSVVVGEK